MADKTEAPKTTMFDWQLKMSPRNLDGAKAKIVRVEATSKQEAINKALSIHPGHAWSDVLQLEAEPPHVLVQEGKPVKAAHEASVIHERPIVPAEALTPEQEQGLWAESWEPTRREGEELSIAQIVQEAIGSASMCWKQIPQGIFDSERASWVAGGAVDAIERVVFWQTGFHPGGKSMTPEEAEQKVAADAHESELLTRSDPREIGMAEEPEECRQARIRRDADKAAVIELILSYRNPADEETRMRQIRVVMD